MSTQKPLIIAHRGAKDLAPENTIAACKLALQNGASALEVDLRLCGSGEVVLYHDNFLWRHFKKPKAVVFTPWQELQTLKFNNRHYQFPDRICTLDEFIKEFKNTVPINLDVKNFLTSDQKLIQAIMRVIDKYQIHHQVWISSFSPVFLWKLKRKFPQIRTGYLFRNFSVVHRFIDRFVKADAWHPHYHLISKRFIELSQRLQKEIYVWTIKEEIVFKEMLQHHFNGIITDVLG